MIALILTCTGRLRYFAVTDIFKATGMGLSKDCKLDFLQFVPFRMIFYHGACNLKP